MMVVPAVGQPLRHRRRRESGLPWLLLGGQAIARAYLIFVLSLATFALAPMLFGMSATVVHGVSMRPVIVAGDVVLSLPYDQKSAIPLGRVVLFEAQSGSGRTGLVIHRIVAIQQNGLLVTKGDGVADADVTPLARADIIAQGKVLIPLIGLPTLWLADGDYLPLVLWALVSALAVLVDAKRPLSKKPGLRDNGLRRASLAAVVLVAALAVGSFALSQAVFTARTGSVGNSWSYAAANPATRLAFTTSPPNSTGGSVFVPQPAVRFEDSNGKVTTSGGSVTLSLSGSGGGSLTCGANPVASRAGISTFSGCSVDKVGTYRLIATSGALTPATSALFTITAGPAQRLVFSTSPTSTTANTTFLTAPVVAVVDAGGNTVSSTASITLSIPQGATLTCGTNPVAASAGKAAFAGCRINTPGSYVLTAASPGLANATSATFLIGGPATPLLTCQDQTWMATFSWSPTPYVPTQYTLYVNGIKVQATGADGWNSYVQLTSNNVPVSLFPQGSATLEVRRVTSTGQEIVIGDGTVVLGSAGYRTYTCH